MVVESGPVVYDDAAADEEDEEEEETCVSAMDLLGNDGQFKHTHTVCLTDSKRTSVQLLIPVDHWINLIKKYVNYSQTEL